MRKNVVIFFISIIFFIPMQVKALEPQIDNVSIKGTYVANEYETVSITFDMNFYDIKNEADTRGILFAGFELVYDQNQFLVYEVESPYFYTQHYFEDDKEYYISVYNGTANTCAGGVLYCSDYSIIPSLYIKNVDNPNATIIEDTRTLMHTVKINKSVGLVAEISKDNTTVWKVTPKIPSINSSSNPSSSSKSNNAYLKELSIENNTISFNKNQTNYIIFIDESVNTLVINVNVDNSKAKYEIKGNDDL